MCVVVLQGDSRRENSLIGEYLKITNERFSEVEEVLPKGWLDFMDRIDGGDVRRQTDWWNTS